jgi:hypothetical protein
VVSKPPAPGTGPVIKLKVGASHGTGAGARVWVKAEFDKARCIARADKTWYPAQQAPFTDKGAGAFLAEARLGDDGTAEVDLRVGVCGGDFVKVTVGSTPACADDTLFVEAWRKFKFQDDSERDLPESVYESVRNAFLECYVDVERVARCAMPRNPIVHKVAGAWIGGGGLLGRPADREYTYIDTTSADASRALWSIYDASYVPQLWKVDGFYNEVGPRTITAKLRSTTTRLTFNAAPGRVFFPKRLGTGANFYVAACRLRGQAVNPTLDVQVAADGKSFSVGLTGQMPEVNGDGIGLLSPLSIELKVIEIRLTGGGALNSNAAVIHFDFRDEAFYTMVLVHEFGHLMGFAFGATRAEYGTARNALQFEEHGFAGNHCSSGLTAEQRAKPEYNLALHHKGVRGDCVMWGSLPPLSATPVTRFCKTCREFARTGEGR